MSNIVSLHFQKNCKHASLLTEASVVRALVVSRQALVKAASILQPESILAEQAFAHSTLLTVFLTHLAHPFSENAPGQ